jgi:hypothetical protein
MAFGSTDAHEGMLDMDRTAALPRGRAPEEAAAREAFIMVTIIDIMIYGYCTVRSRLTPPVSSFKLSVESRAHPSKNLAVAADVTPST